MDDEFQVWVLGCEGAGDEAVGTAEVDDGCVDGVEGSPVVVLEEVGDFVAFAAGEGCHGSSHALCADGVFAEGDEHWLDVGCVVCCLETGLGWLGSGGVVGECRDDF